MGMTRATPAVLYHYTCDHRWPMILADGHLNPGPDGLVWLTDLATPIRDALGLTSLILNCDRTEHRVTVPTDGQPIAWWPMVRRAWLAGPDTARVVRGLESADGARPAHWWVAARRLDIT